MSFQQLIERSRSILAVSAVAAQEYSKQQEAIRRYVDQQLLQQEDLTALLGHHSGQIMLDNHQYHVQFMSTVFTLNSYELLARIVIWVYRSYHQRGFSYAYFERVMPVWQQAVAAQLTATSAAQINAVYHWMEVEHATFVRIAESKMDIPFPFAVQEGSFTQSCMEPLLFGDFELFSRMGAHYLHTGKTLRDLYVEVLQPCLYEVGRRWEMGEISVAQEHLATALVSRTMYQTAGKMPLVKKSKGKVVLTAAPNEFHELGAQMVADLLEFAGWDVIYLGANTPREDLQGMVRSLRPFFLGVAAVMPFTIDAVEEIITGVREDPATKDIKVMVGGLAFSHARNLGQTVGADGYAADAVAAVELADSWWKENLDEAKK